MKWKGRRSSENVEDMRGQRVARTAGAGTLLTLVGRTFGLKGIIWLVAIVAVLWMTGLVDPSAFLGGPVQTQSGPYQATPEEQERYDFVTVVLADTEDIWTAEFAARGMRYTEPALVVYSGAVNTGCGMGQAQMGPFYCPADQKVYIDLGFYDELEQTFQAPGDFAQAYVIAHEVGHHVQNLLGIMEQTSRLRQRMSEGEYNAVSVRVELQADCFAGVWAHHAQRDRKILEPGDLEEALRAASAIGDDVLQKRSQGYVVPDSFTHGSAAQRVRWFRTGYETGSMQACNTFEARAL